LKSWRKKKKPLQNQLNDIEEKIKEIQEKPFQEQDHNAEEKLTVAYEQTMTRLTEYYKQRAKKHWAIHGDKNTRYFHLSVLKRRRKNRIVSINNSQGQTTVDPEEIAQCFVSYFKNIFTSSTFASSEQIFHVIQAGTIQDEFTNSVPDKEEVWNILKGMRNDASPGPDGLNAAFYKAAWSWIGNDITKLVKKFYLNGYIPQQLNETNIALIPKKVQCIQPQDFRPISLCNVVYKIIAKSLANRIKPHLPNKIIDAQQAFIEGRRISNNVIVAQEITHSFSLNSWKQKAFMIKIDLAKAFDRLEWDFIVLALQKQGFNSHFIKLIKACISNSKFSVIINGNHYGKFKSQRGIRQGCPLSPYLFVIAINELAVQLQEELQKENIKGVTLGPNCPSIFSMMFADDLLVCGQANQREAKTIWNTINNFCKRSGQTPNWSKSSILFSKNVNEDQRNLIKKFFMVEDMNNQSIHLGHPLILPAKNRAQAYNFVIQKLKSKLSCYKTNKMAHAARLVLIKSVLSSIPVYYMSNILLSKKILAKMNAIIRDFWWTGIQQDSKTKPIYFKAWSEICKSKKEGGLGVRNLEAINKALILTAAWNIATLPDSNTTKILKAKYFHNTSFWKANPKLPKSAFWTSILKVKDQLTDAITYQFFKGNTNILSEPWCPFWRDIHRHLIIQDDNFVYPATVSDLWMPKKKWNVPLITKLFGIQNANMVAGIL
jgi:hypothetical protein